MSQALRQPTRATVEDYLAFENASELKHEFVDGVIYAMVGATDRHNLTAFTLGADIFAHLKPPCQLFQGQMKLRIKTATFDAVYYPDVMVSCSPADRDSIFRREPLLIAEVLSPSTERYDRAEKFSAYQQIPALEEYVLIATDVPQIEIFRRRSAWEVETLHMADALMLESIGLTLPVAQIYRSVTF